MTASTPFDARQASILVFGGHIGPQSKKSLQSSIRNMMLGPNGPWLLDAVAGLPRVWDAVAEQIPELTGKIPGLPLLAELAVWLRQMAETDTEESDESEMADIWLGPLMVALQLEQYWRYLEFRMGDVDDPQAALVRNNRSAESGAPKGAPAATLGFCAGLIGAVAAASAHDRAEFARYGTVALRLGLLMAIIVQAREDGERAAGTGGSASLALAWRTARQGADMARIVEAFGDTTYISVLFDTGRATITTTARTAPTLARQLRAAGVKAVPLAFRGYLHAPDAGQRKTVEAVLALCRLDAGLQLPATAADLALAVYCNQADGRPLAAGQTDLTGMVLRSILVDQFNWTGTLSKLLAAQSDVSIVALGLDRCIPPTVVRQLGARQVHYEELHLPARKVQRDAKPSSFSSPAVPPPEPIAVVGMAIKVAGADDVDEFATLLKAGTSQHEEITAQRMVQDHLFRAADPQKRYYGNFMRDNDAFDHRFFRRSPRESQAMDPQSRLALQVAYQAVEQAGYAEDDSGRHVGTYVGLCAIEYDNNVSCHAPTAFTATGGLRGFIAGRLAHHFNWTGPSMTFDTACSSSTVAIHTACSHLRAGDVEAAVCGGVSVMTSMLWMQNLAAGSFLSPTGACKPFDAAADGYCRAEGIAFVVLKRLRDALADGDTVLGTIRGSGVYQNTNDTPLFVPNVPSLTRLFGDVLQKADVRPADVSLVEAHGTGTAVGDPAEYESVLRALQLRSAAPERPIPIGSVKGHIGHTEGASGVISLIKVLVMMRDGFLPPQASFARLNPHIAALPGADHLEVVTTLRPWAGGRKIALINNYGASGSNSCMVVASPDWDVPMTSSPGIGKKSLSRLPFWIPGFDARSISARAAAMADFVEKLQQTHQPITLADTAFHIARQTNRGLPRALLFSCDSLAALSAQLRKSAENVSLQPPPPPIVLCFGGQVSTWIGLDRAIYDGIAILRHHLDDVDSTARAQGLASIFPAIFAREAIEDTVQLQICLLALQYACARSWLDCGMAGPGRVAAVVGHSFGEISALCVAGVLSLADAVRLVAGRSRLVRDVWGVDPGAMLAIEADRDVVDGLLAAAAGGSASIACYNGPRSFTLAGSTAAIDAVEAAVAAAGSKNIRYKRLHVTNAFHSALVDPLLDGLAAVGRGVTWNDPVLPVERATETASASPLNATFVPTHMRQPVFFHHAIQRLAQKHPTAVFLEAGSSSTITVMAARVLASSSSSSDLHFQAMAITNTDRGMDALTDATLALWKLGVRTTFWPHHASQASDYASLLLPPYNFDKTRHWVPIRSPAELIHKAAQELLAAQLPTATPEHNTLLTFLGHQSVSPSSHTGSKVARFRINTASEKYQRYFSTHVIAQTAPICPATFEIGMAIEALFSLKPEWRADGYSPTTHDLTSSSPMCADPTRTFYVDLAQVDAADESRWHFWIRSTGPGDAQTHAEAGLRIRSSTDASYTHGFDRYARMVHYGQCAALLQRRLVDDDDDDNMQVLQGRNVYRAFADVVDFGPVYRRVRCIVGRSTDAQHGESAGIVHAQNQGEAWIDVPLSDACGQVAGLYVNVLATQVDLPPSDMFVATGCELTMRAPSIPATPIGRPHGPAVWHVLARHVLTEKSCVSDVFIFDAATGQLTEFMIGLQYVRVAKATMRKILTRMTTDRSQLRENHEPRDVVKVEVKKAETSRTNTKSEHRTAPKTSLTDQVCELVASVSGVETGEMTLASEMADLGIDSLMGMELAREVEQTFGCAIDQATMMEAATLGQFVACIADALGVSTSESDGDSKESSDADDDDADTDISAPDDAKVSPPPSSLALAPSDVLACFGTVKLQTDDQIRAHRLDRFANAGLAASSRLVTALLAEALAALGAPLQSALPGQQLARVSGRQPHPLVDFCYRFLEHEARLLDSRSGTVQRTQIDVPSKTSAAVLEQLLQTFPEFSIANRLAYHVGTRLASVLRGDTDSHSVLFDSPDGPELIQSFYREYAFNRLHYQQMADVLRGLAERLSHGNTPLHVLEMDSSVGGTSGLLRFVAPVLAALSCPVTYTYAHPSASVVARVRNAFSAQYPFLRFAVRDIDKPPADDLQGKFHVVLACHTLAASLQHIRKSLRPDGFLMLLEMTEAVPVLDLALGLDEDWWSSDDSGSFTHAMPAERWETVLQDAGFGHVDWTDGQRPENSFQRVILALASGSPQPRLPMPTARSDFDSIKGDVAAREAEAERLAEAYTQGWAESLEADADANTDVDIRANDGAESSDMVVVLTGATGSLGAHLVQVLGEQPSVATVVCLNRRSTSVPDAARRQDEALAARGIALSPAHHAKLRVYATDTSQPRLGLPKAEHAWLVRHATHIVHNAWPMSGTRPVVAFAQQFRTMRQLLDLARDASAHQKNITFQFVSSIGVVGLAKTPRVPEGRVSMDVVLPGGYTEAKWAHERMLDVTLHRFPARFRAMVVRPGQISGSTATGYWNPIEHFCFLVKSAQSLGVWPQLRGNLQWLPVDVCAAAMADLLVANNASGIFHLDNPVGQSWEAASDVLAGALGVSSQIPWSEWLARVRRSPLRLETDNPAARVVDFLQGHFVRMSCGSLVLDTQRTQAASPSLARQGPVSAEVLRAYVASWKSMGFLKE